MTTELLSIEIIRTDGGTQSRAGLNEKTLTDYVDALHNGDQFPPIDVAYDGVNYWLYDGYHRHEAHRRAGRTHINATIHQGDQAEAQWRSYAANPTHGLQRTQEDKERAIKAALRHPKAAGLSDSSLAKHLHVSDKTVTKYRRELEAAGDITVQAIRIGADGRAINTANIGANRKQQSSPSPTPDSSDLLAPVVIEWLRFYSDRFQRTWRDLRSIVNIPTSKHYTDIRAYLHDRGFRTDDASLGSAIASAFAHLEKTETEQVEDRIYRLQNWLIGKGWGIGANSISSRTQTFTWPDNDPPAHLAALKQAESIQKTTQAQPSPTSETPKSTGAVELSSTKATELIWAALNAKEFAPTILPAKIAYVKNVPLEEFRRFLAAGETVTDATLQAAIDRVEAALLLAIDHCRHPATAAATGRCVDCGLDMNAAVSDPRPAPTDDREITETLDAAIRRAVCVYAGDREKWQALAESGADYWQILDLLKACINSTGGSSGPGCYYVDRRRGPIVVISKDIGGPVVQKLMSGALVAAVRKAWGIPEHGGTHLRDAQPSPADYPIHPIQPSAATPIDAKLTQARDLRTAINAVLQIIDSYGELTGNHDAPAAAVRVLQPMLNRLEIMTQEVLPGTTLPL